MLDKINKSELNKPVYPKLERWENKGRGEQSSVQRAHLYKSNQLLAPPPICRTPCSGCRNKLWTYSSERTRQSGQTTTMLQLLPLKREQGRGRQEDVHQDRRR